MKPSVEHSVATTCCFTGHRNQKLPWRFKENDLRCIKMKESARNQIVSAIKRGYNHFISGMAIGFDMICAEIILQLKKEYHHIILECALPCQNQEKMWNEEYKQRYYNILSKADVIKYCSEFYTFRCMQDRNMYMINHSSLVIALFNGSKGGTANTLKYATEHNKKIIIIKPIQ